MKKEKRVQKLFPDQLDQVSGGVASQIKYVPGQGKFQKESKDFFRQCVGDEIYQRAMNSDAGRMHHYVVARAFLSQADWQRFAWIEEHGSLEGYPW